MHRNGLVGGCLMGEGNMAQKLSGHEKKGMTKTCYLCKLHVEALLIKISFGQKFASVFTAISAGAHVQYKHLALGAKAREVGLYVLQLGVITFL